MKKRCRVSLLFMSLLVFLFCISGVVSAAPLPPPDTEISTDQNKSIVIHTREVTTDGITLISDWGCGIRDVGNRKVNISGLTGTAGYGMVDYCDATVYLQQWNGSSWVNVTSRTYSAYNSIEASGFSNISVTGGYYYRSCSTHSARDGSLLDYQTTISQAVFIQ
ncbi:MAG: hypothetical protein ACOX5W_06155 [Bacillota bacterium]|jgi:hypothetical protein